MNRLRYLGMSMFDALAAAQLAGEQLRVMAVNHITHMHGDVCPPEHIKVWVKDGKVNKVE